MAAATRITDDYVSERDAEDLQDAMLGVPASRPSEDYYKVLTQLRSRQQVARRLQASYSAFSALATYDASGEFVQSASGLFDAIDAAGGAAGLPTKTARDALGQIGGELVGLDQARRLRRASLTLSSALQTYLDILNGSSVGFISIEKRSITAHYQAVQQLWGTQLLESSKLMATLEPEDGLLLVEKGDFTSRNPKVDTIVRYVLARRAAHAQDAIYTLDQANRDLVSALIKKHHAFEAGQSLDLAEVEQLVNALAATTSTIAQAKGK